MPKPDIRYILQNTVKKILKVFNIEVNTHFQIFKLEIQKSVFLTKIFLKKMGAFFNNI